MTHFNNNHHAIVIGGSMAGMMAAKVLANYFEQVTIIERDNPHEGSQPRQGVPQGHHVHVLLKRGEQTLARLFPGIWQEMEALGSQNVDMASKLHWFHYGVWKACFNSNFPIYIQSRPLLEWKVRHRLARAGNVSFRYNTIVTHLLTSADKSRVTGVQMRQGGHVAELTADLVIDASGRGSQTPRWLQELGYQAPTESTVKINLGYASRLYRPAPHQTPDWQGLAVYPKMPESKRGGLIFRVEHDKWLVTMIGYAGDTPSHKEDEFMAFAESLPHPSVAQALKQATPVSDIKTFKYPQEVRRHYEKLQRFPDGLLVLGDAFCSFDPVFGQGMSVAAMEAEALDKCLHQTNGKVAGLSRRFHKSIAKLVMVPWLLATSEGLRFDEVEGDRPFFLKALHWYNSQIFELTGASEEVYADFLQVLHLLKLPTLLFRPKTIWRVLQHYFSKRKLGVNGRPAQAWAASGD